MIIKHLKASAYEVKIDYDFNIDDLRDDKDILNLTYIKEKIGSVNRYTIVIYLSPKIPYYIREQTLENKFKKPLTKY